MRIFSALLFVGVLAITSAARADSAVNDCQPNTDDGGGCACDHGTFHFCDRGNDLSIPRVPDMAAPKDLAPPLDDAGLDARRERRRRRNASNGRGLVLLSGASVLVLAALRRRYKTRRPTPAESALAASATRSDS